MDRIEDLEKRITGAIRFCIWSRGSYFLDEIWNFRTIVANFSFVEGASMVEKKLFLLKST